MYLKGPFVINVLPRSFTGKDRLLPTIKYAASTKNTVNRIVLNVGWIFIVGRPRAVSICTAAHHTKNVIATPIGPTQKMRLKFDSLSIYIS